MLILILAILIFAVQVSVFRRGPYWSRDCDDDSVHSKEICSPSSGGPLCGVPHQAPQSRQRLHASHSGYCQSTQLHSQYMIVEELKTLNNVNNPLGCKVPLLKHEVMFFLKSLLTGEALTVFFGGCFMT